MNCTELQNAPAGTNRANDNGNKTNQLLAAAAATYVPATAGLYTGGTKR